MGRDIPVAEISRVEAIPRKLSWYNYRCVAFAAVGSIIYGYCLSAVATTLGQPTFYTYFNLETDATKDKAAYDHMVVIQGLCTSLSQAGGFFGCLFNSWAADRYGRLRAFQIAAVIVIIGGALTAGAVNIAMFLVFRFIGGWGVGMILVLFPMYAAELSPPRSRGFLVGQHGPGLAIGYNSAAAVSLGCFFAKNGSLAWRLPLALQCLFPLILLTFSFWMPQSPRWLILKDRLEEAKEILIRIHRAPDDENDNFALAEFDLMVAQIHYEREKSGGAVVSVFSRWKYMFSKRSYIHRCLLGFGIMFGIQGTGVLVINNYQIILYPGLGVGAGLSLGLYWVYLAIALVGNTCCSLYVDKLGRKLCFLIGLLGSLSALVGETVASSFLPTTNKAVLVTGVFFIFWYIPWFSSMVDATMYIYMSEIWPSEIRSEGIALSVSGQWLASIAFLQASPTGFANCGYKFYLLFVFCTAAMFIVIYFYYPETANIPMEEMGRLFGEKVAGTLEEELRERAATGHGVLHEKEDAVEVEVYGEKTQAVPTE